MCLTLNSPRLLPLLTLSPTPSTSGARRETWKETQITTLTQHTCWVETQSKQTHSGPSQERAEGRERSRNTRSPGGRGGSRRSPSSPASHPYNPAQSNRYLYFKEKVLAKLPAHPRLHRRWAAGSQPLNPRSIILSCTNAASQGHEGLTRRPWRSLQCSPVSQHKDFFGFREIHFTITWGSPCQLIS